MSLASGASGLVSYIARLADDRKQFRHAGKVYDNGNDLAAHALIGADVALELRHVPAHADIKAR